MGKTDIWVQTTNFFSFHSTVTKKKNESVMLYFIWIWICCSKKNRLNFSLWLRFFLCLCLPVTVRNCTHIPKRPHCSTGLTVSFGYWPGCHGMIGTYSSPCFLLSIGLQMGSWFTVFNYGWFHKLKLEIIYPKETKLQVYRQENGYDTNTRK